METLKSVLEANHTKKTKNELIELLSGVQQILSPNVYDKISGVEISELKDLSTKEILSIIDQFKSAYDEKWEKSLAGASSQVLKMISMRMAADDEIFRTSDASNADFAAELGSIDFATVIGGPLDACVKAQSNASVSTVSFINEVGFEATDPNNPNSPKKLRMADFKYKKNVPNPDFDDTKPESNSNPKTIQQDVELSVPFIALLNVPCFRIESCEVDFNVKLNSTYTKDVSNNFGIDAGASGGWGPVKFSVNVSYKRSSSTGIKVEKEYSLGVKVRATNDEMPAGLEKVLGLLAQ
ncbi:MULTISPECIES: DUF2589 domain-containing protein [Chryseobacterium]|uniref:Protein of uncharacterized function (DUF2589) n=1 Tax=Chryseobacterium taihuense TaxID=1141221 RepID=A0A4U8WBD2_9FLAO|nr:MULTISPECIES: DUF2589 domain-containing protein [Chryseobacterium]QQV03128.1 DUF2589 domain-containing protein [Chryseobacterium sp. FDAARGOS 1104]VFB03572.1 Protein of uncharacterised function (DUF2589) [Chryseobacterium taihuense]